jgi:hypothetical protein
VGCLKATRTAMSPFIPGRARRLSAAAPSATHGFCIACFPPNKEIKTVLFLSQSCHDSSLHTFHDYLLF